MKDLNILLGNDPDIIQAFDKRPTWLNSNELKV